jgi:hypothetical protein
VLPWVPDPIRRAAGRPLGARSAKSAQGTEAVAVFEQLEVPALQTRYVYVPDPGRFPRLSRYEPLLVTVAIVVKLALPGG